MLDSPVNNATAHYLHNMLYVLGDSIQTSATLVSLTGELYRANDISNFDTGALRCVTDQGVEVLFWSAHAVERLNGPLAVYEFTNATVTFDSAQEEPQFIATFRDGTTKTYGNPNLEQRNKFFQAVDAVRGGTPVACPVEAASAQTLCVNGLQDAVPDITPFPADLVKLCTRGDSPLTYVDGLASALETCFDRNALPSELGFPWARAGRTVDLTNYGDFPGGA